MYRSVVRLRRNIKDTANLTSLNELVRDIDRNVHSGEFCVLNIFYCIFLLYSDCKGCCKPWLCNYINNTSGLWDIVKNCTYVGLADETFALLQYNTHLYLMNVVNVRYAFHRLNKIEFSTVYFLLSNDDIMIRFQAHVFIQLYLTNLFLMHNLIGLSNGFNGGYTNINLYPEMRLVFFCSFRSFLSSLC